MKQSSPEGAPRGQGLLRNQLLRLLLLPLSVLLCADAVLSYSLSVKFANRAYDHALLEIAREVALHIESGPTGLQFSMSEGSRRILFADADDRVHFGVTAPDGGLLGGMQIPPPGAKLSEQSPLHYDGTIEGHAVRVVQLLHSGDTPAALATVRVAETLTKRNALAREVLISIVIPQLVLIALASLAVFLGVQRGLQPLERVQRALARRSHLDLRRLREEGIPGEVVPLVRSVNELLGRLERSRSTQNRFIADAAHQLKTPVAALMAQIEVAMREPDPSHAVEYLPRLLQSAERLSRIAHQLLSLARTEPDAINGVTATRIDLNQLTFEAASQWLAEADKKNIDLGLHSAEQPVWVNGDAVRLRELLDNLIENAILYSRPGGSATVAVASGVRPSVAVSDDGPLIAVDDHERIFERFQRLDANAEPGSGLGLAIAREIARMHDADISVHEDADGVGNVFRVTFPAA